MAKEVDLVAQFPNWNVKPLDANGNWSRPWLEFWIKLFQRQGGQSGGDGQLTIGDVLGLQADIPAPVDISAQVAQLSIGLQQAFAAIAAIQQAIPGFGEAFAQASGQGAQAAEPVFATAAGASSLSEMTFARV
ncbi:hypothetical protein MJ546_33890, partial [Burkholderia gladioli]|uniref:hypothetical protein n=1 Tax=Burkholderia gladioli TaxID=28095 RepID=UPI000BBD27CE|nr:hypothetical protein [Burkholderia gladioli]ATF86883.1 hypothetical protein CO712_18785 [Burkholderia gladioli pv. gladioli]